MTLTKRQKIAGGAGAVLAVAAITGGVIASSGSGTTETVYACVRSDGLVRADTIRVRTSPPTCPATSDHVVSWTAARETSPTTTTVATTTTTTVPNSSTTTTRPTTTTTTVPTSCVGVPMTSGQPDIDSHPTGTTFCLTGTHTGWTLNPASGDTIVGDGTAILDGGGVTVKAIGGSGSNVTVTNVEVRRYVPPNQAGAIRADGTTGWTLNGLYVHDNGTACATPGATSGCGGWGAVLGTNARVNGGRFSFNRQGGIAGGSASGWIVDGTEIDHNNYTTDSSTVTNVSCDYEGGGMKWVGGNVTVKNAYVHDNACKGLWSDINSNGITLTNNRVINNDQAGIFIEISSNGTVSGNTTTGNGRADCSWLWDGGITLASSDHFTVFNNTVSGNCNGITGTQQNRPDGVPGLLANLSIHDNAIAGPGGKTGAAADNGANLATRSIVFSANTFSNGMAFCNLSC